MGRSGPQQIPGRRLVLGALYIRRDLSLYRPFQQTNQLSRVPVRTSPSRVYSRKLEHTA